jgi:hypothetical protein
MALFPKEETAPGIVVGDARQRMAWTRELGTRQLVIGFVALLLVWFVYGKIRDAQLLSSKWPALQPDSNGLTVVGTLDARDNIGRNMFHIIEANKASRPEITDFGWNSIFDPANGEMFSEQTSNAIKNAISQDNQVGYRMLEPYLRYGVAQLMGQHSPAATITKDTPITVGDGATAKQVPLGDLLDKYAREGDSGEGKSSEDADAGGSEGERDVEHGTALPAETMIHVCPVVLTGAQFTDAWVEEQDEPLMGIRTYMLHMGLTPEGRSRFFQWSHSHVNEHIVYVLKDQIATAGRIKMVLDVNELEVGPLRDKNSAYGLVNYLNNRTASAAPNALSSK